MAARNRKTPRAVSHPSRTMVTMKRHEHGNCEAPKCARRAVFVVHRTGAHEHLVCDTPGHLARALHGRGHGPARLELLDWDTAA